MKEILYYKSSNGINNIYAEIYNCENPKCVLQIAHGMCEYITRYEDFAKYLNKHNIVVAGNDHLGHGRSAEILGYFGEGDNLNYAVDDIEKLSLILKERYDLPIYYLGHSMGSFIMRYFISKYSAEKCILMGTGYIDDFSATVLDLLSIFISKVKGDKYVSKLLVKLSTGAYAKKVKGHTYDWISYNKKNVEKFANDPLCNYSFTVNGYRTLGKYLLKINTHFTIDRTNRETKILFVSGEDDPVGNFKKGVLKIYNKYKKKGFKNIKLIFYKNMRHEILNEDNREIVYSDILNFLEN